LAVSDIMVWARRTDHDSEALSAALERILSPEERSRAARFVHHADRRDFIAAHALLRHALSRHDGTTRPAAWRFSNDPTGKPVLMDAPMDGQQLTFNLSHTTGFVACVVGRDRSVGIDVERIRMIKDARLIAERHFARQEIKSLDRLRGEEYVERFIELWTLKEAYLKGMARGMALPLDSCAFRLADNRLSFDATPTTDSWRFWLFQPVPGLKLAIAAVFAAHEELRLRIATDEGPRSALLSRARSPLGCSADA
jgi:4'-phosphopantetheinyl transferase